MALLLESAGFVVSPMVDGGDALAYLKEGGRASVVVLDLMMPRVDGWTFRRAQLADPGDCRHSGHRHVSVRGGIGVRTARGSDVPKAGGRHRSDRRGAAARRLTSWCAVGNGMKSAPHRPTAGAMPARRILCDT